MFGKEKAYYETHDSIFTASEIAQQPDAWRKTIAIVKDHKETLNDFLKEVLDKPDYEVIFTGAGTSEFVGNSIYPYLASVMEHRVHSYASTDIVACPSDYLDPKRPTLLVSFARSGNSPESVAAVALAEKICGNIRHLFITCNPDGQLAVFGRNRKNCYVLNMPPETNDQSFAMTSSYSSMYLAAVIAFMQYLGLPFEKQAEMIIANTARFFSEDAGKLQKLCHDFTYNRIVYLGSNVLKGVAQESALKTCELATGNVMTTFDSTMGFRHGPKSVVKNDSLVIVYLSDDPYTRQYDLDIVSEIHGEHIGKLIAITGGTTTDIRPYCDYAIGFGNNQPLENIFLGLEFITVGQLLGMFKALELGNTPDSPCVTGQVSRVVHGVTIHEY